MRIAFFGLPLAALCLLRDGHEIVLASLSRPELPGTRRLRRALGDARVLVKPRVDRRFAARIRGADLVVSWFWTRKLPIEVVRAAPLGGFGVHPSLLPRHRGPDPYFWAIDRGDAETGVTAHRLDAEYDTGAMLGSRAVAIDPSWDAWRLARALDPPSLALLREVAAAFAAGRPPREVAQDEAFATEAPAPSDELLEIDWNRPAAAIVRRVRAAAPYPGAWTFVGDEALVVTRACVVEGPRALRPGEATVVDGRAVVAASVSAVALQAGRLVVEDAAGDREVAVGARAIAALVAAAAEDGDDVRARPVGSDSR